ncbi:hypothetical protein CA13_66700 [Planctomycetes bacterium CA13]|uniref:Glycosyltransferase RgtA/B/C/D-like domain-containing protein n=1 Tax=Novipirellula herctigrandis TaxID=2527986 RepID=A0A5C5YMW2_9BACT|nr:hypothetical protein CA13_66700 [Planctomycetes bacterium CA13]
MKKSKSFWFAILFVCGVLIGGALASEKVHCSELRLGRITSASRDEFGSENDSIAKAIYCGHGFSDPFGLRTGPTAWMPPGMPYLLAGMYVVADGNRQLVCTAFFWLQWSLVLLIGLSAVVYGFQYGGAITMAMIFSIGCVSLYLPLFFQTHAHSLEMMAVVAAFLSLRLLRTPTLSNVLCSGMVGGMIAWIYPAAALAWGAIAVYELRKFPLLAINALLMATLLICPWLSRNYVQFGKLYPVKSNSSYELWQALQVTNAGLLTTEIFAMHPLNPSSTEHLRYRDLGETAYLADKGDQAIALLRESPLKWLRQVVHRIHAAYLWQQPWFEADGFSERMLLLQRLWKLAVTLSIVVLMIRRSAKREDAMLAAMLILVITVPYVLVSYYERYSWPLFPMQVLVVFLAVQSVTNGKRLLRFPGGQSKTRSGSASA